MTVRLTRCNSFASAIPTLVSVAGDLVDVKPDRMNCTSLCSEVLFLLLMLVSCHSGEEAVGRPSSAERSAPYQRSVRGYCERRQSRASGLR